MLAIKLSRKGRKKQPFFRVIILEKAKDPRGDFLENLGFYNPFTKEVSLKKERVKYWLSKGAQPTGSVHNLLIAQGIIKDEKKLSKKRKAGKKESRLERWGIKISVGLTFIYDIDIFKHKFQSNKMVLFVCSKVAGLDVC
ncbi:30S ribosomal protein S16 [Candidatus Parcubacteria bacterium 4484_255]|nr:MAG: 30S ribosomal protein S16 [Candidatus Parcubacteria bacterium 4484_255]